MHIFFKLLYLRKNLIITKSFIGVRKFIFVCLYTFFPPEYLVIKIIAGIEVLNILSLYLKSVIFYEIPITFFFDKCKRQLKCKM